MSRESADQYVDGRLMNGFDYDKQQWVIDGKYQHNGESTKGIDLTHAYEHTMLLNGEHITLLHKDLFQPKALERIIDDARKHLKIAEVKDWLVSELGFVELH